MRKNCEFLAAMFMLAVFSGEAYALNLVYSDHEPLGNMRTTFLNDVFFKAVEEKSGGNVKIVPRWNGEVSISYDALKTVKDGTKAQIAVIVPEYCPDELPLHQVFKSFPTGPTGQEQVDFFRGIYSEIPELMQEVDAQELHIIFVATGYPAAFFSAKAIPDIHGIRGQKWRSASFWHKDFLSNSGAFPVTMRWGQGVFDALNDGTLDGLLVNVDSGYDINAHKAAPYILTSQKLWLGHEYIIAMNKSVWNSLTDNDRQAIETAADFSYGRLGKIMDEAFVRQLEILSGDNASVRILSNDEVDFWEKSSDYINVQDKWADELSAKGVSASVKVLAEVRRYMKTFTGETTK